MSDTQKRLKKLKERLDKLNRKLKEDLPKELSKCSDKCKKIADLTGELDDHIRQHKSATSRGLS